MSESVFAGLCEIVGTSEQVTIRREALDFNELLDRQLISYCEVIMMVSGSHREGFRLRGSDLDLMYWPNTHRVIMNMSQSEFYNTANTTMILSDSSGSPPGFTLLQLLTPSRYQELQLACVIKNDRVYISSSIWRQIMCDHAIPNSKVHGPCGSGALGTMEYDTAHCFISNFWPPSASSWIDRCHSWPDPEVVNDIFKNGCHFVAIGHPLGLHENEEWRMSFSRAEYKLVYSMNHCQFLTYGLLKLFLKEVINQQSEEEINKLLCSYHMKTIVFWAIQQNTLPYLCPQNFLAGFWVCFKLLLKWVYEGICPNFFIPRNNMFLAKVHGSAQNRLFLQLHELYKKGLACLLESFSIKPYITDVLYNPRALICTDERLILSEFDHDADLVQESIIAISKDFAWGDLYCVINAIHTIEQFMHLPLTQYQVVNLQALTTFVFKNSAFILHNMYTNTGVNKQMYVADKMFRHLLKLAAKFGYVSDMLYLAIYYYKTFRYRKALSVIEMTKVKLAQPYLMYMGCADRDKYTEAVGGQSWLTKRQAIAMDIGLANNICQISELIPEQQSAIQNRWPISTIPVFVMLHFLDFLCNRHIDTTLSQAALDELQFLVHHDWVLSIDDAYGDISWEILGICQQITGNLQAALYSYQQSLTQYPHHRIQTATQKRIQDLVQYDPNL
ncbi:uncharacterized protein LOC128175567 [Crassostrea angulata]|uniref:uncharacterized protein LOC128175567 n=1 Tax=Magallana angulata TaxID=2784310 RepID=UPI0022B15386|nr:uncharacterized protein LOC128175567 [Crassostrea angulata]